MKKGIIFFSISALLIFIFFVFYKSLNKTSSYKPKSEIKDVPEFISLSFFSKKEEESKKIFNESKYYLLNIWASWCGPCRDEHSLLISLSKDNNLEIIGLNYKDNLTNAKKFLDELGNPYEKVFIDQDGTI